MNIDVFEQGAILVNYEKEAEMAECNKDGCTKNAHTKGICITHYQKLRRMKKKADGTYTGN